MRIIGIDSCNAKLLVDCLDIHAIIVVADERVEWLDGRLGAEVVGDIEEAELFPAGGHTNLSLLLDIVEEIGREASDLLNGGGRLLILVRRGQSRGVCLRLW